MNLGAQVKKARKQRGFTQLQLAVRAGIGVATLQNIEANRANPEFSTLNSLLKVLKVRMVFEFEKVETDLEELALFGCPLLRTSPSAGSGASRAGLIERANWIDLGNLKGREARAVAAWVQAIRDHYASVWNELPPALRAWADNQSPDVKLRRIALSRLSEFL